MKIAGDDQNGQWKDVGVLYRYNKSCLLISKPVETKLLDDAGAYLYTGYAIRGSATSGAVWLIYRTDTTTGSKKTASVSFNQIWDNRTSLTYA